MAPTKAQLLFSFYDLTRKVAVCYKEYTVTGSEEGGMVYFVLDNLPKGRLRYAYSITLEALGEPTITLVMKDEATLANTYFTVATSTAVSTDNIQHIDARSCPHPIYNIGSIESGGARVSSQQVLAVALTGLEAEDIVSLLVEVEIGA